MWWIIPTMKLVSYRQPDRGLRVGQLDGDLIRELRAPSMLAWLSGEGREATGEEHPLGGVSLVAPIPEPPSVRDFYAYEGHVATGWRKRGAEIPEAWYDAPAFYFSNPAAIHGPGEPVSRPEATRMLDFELEIAAVLGRDGEIAGFTLLNDWSARDVQRREVTVGLGPAKAKDFALSMGPWLVTPDELPYEAGRLQLEATAAVNGVELTRTRAGDKHFSWPDLVAHAGRDTRLRPGDVLGSGTLHRGCLLELGPLEGGRYLEPGDEVAISAEGLGTLTTPIV
jgi:fumarylacetoacetate (FAA) hydrolase